MAPALMTTALSVPYTGHNVFWYAPVNSVGVGWHMKAELHPGALPGGSKPSVRPNWWPSTGATGDWFKRCMVQGHLLNENLGGPGNTLTNLTPLTKHANSMHLQNVEKYIKAKHAKGRVVLYECEAKFDGITGQKIGATGAVATDITNNYAHRIPSHMTCEFQILDAKGKPVPGEAAGESYVIINAFDKRDPC